MQVAGLKDNLNIPANLNHNASFNAN